MGQYYLAYVRKEGKKPVVFDNTCGGEWNGLKLMEHSWWLNDIVGNVVNNLFYNKAHVCWVGDYYGEDDYRQVNCSKDKVKEIGDYVWNEATKKRISKFKNVRYLTNCLIVNHTKKLYVNCDNYFERSKVKEEYEGQTYFQCIHPLPLLTCSANHSGGSYGGTCEESCGTWFNDEIEVVLSWEEKFLKNIGYTELEVKFKEE